MDTEKMRLRLHRGPLSLAATVLVMLLTAAPSMADTYRIEAMKGVTVSCGGRLLGRGDYFDDSRNAPTIKWGDTAGAYIKFFNVTTGTEGVVVAPASTRKGFWDRVKGYFSDIRKCSTRGDGSTDGLTLLSDRLSQTFHMLDRDGEAVEIATGLPLDSCRYLEAEYVAPGVRETSRLRFGNRDGMATLTPADFSSMHRSGPLTTVRLTVSYVDLTTGRRLQLCDGMNLVLVRP